jgi:transposase InsO family protein
MKVSKNAYYSWLSNLEKVKKDTTKTELINKINQLFIAILDLADRKIVGWTLSDDMTTNNTVYKTWLLARNNRSITDNHIFHSDRGSQYSCHKMSLILNNNIKITQSMSRKGNCWDNAVAESFFKTIKYECLYRYRFTSSKSLYDCIADYIHWYNTERLHSSLGYKTPLQKELELRSLKKIAA